MGFQVNGKDGRGRVRRGVFSQIREEVENDQQSGGFRSVRAHMLMLSVSMVLVNSINVIFLAPLFMILAKGRKQIM